MRWLPLVPPLSRGCSGMSATGEHPVDPGSGHVEDDGARADPDSPVSRSRQRTPTTRPCSTIGASTAHAWCGRPPVPLRVDRELDAQPLGELDLAVVEDRCAVQPVDARRRRSVAALASGTGCGASAASSAATARRR